MVCPICDQEVAPGAVFCSQCGENLAAPVEDKWGPSNWMITAAAVAALASVTLAVWSSFGPRQRIADLRAQMTLPNDAATASPSPSPSPTPSLSATPVAFPPIEPGDYQTYSNDRFDYSISFPANFLTRQETAPNGDGRSFLSADGRVAMVVYGLLNTREKSLKDLYEEEMKPGRQITYQIRKDKWFVVSGFENNKVFYQKTYLKDDVIKTFYIQADRDLQSIVQPMTERIAQSFK
jgi:hypothetical protein